MAITLTHVGEITGAGSPNYLDIAIAVKVYTINGTPYALVISNSDDHLSIFDVSTPSSPSLTGTWGGAGSPNYMDTPNGIDVATIGDKVYAFIDTYIDNALVIVDVSTPSSPSLAGVIHGTANHINRPSDLQVYTIGGTEYAVVANRATNELALFDVSDPSTPTYVGSLSGAGSPNYLSEVAGVFVTTIGGTEYAFCAVIDDDCLTIVDISTPGSPSHTATIAGAGSPNYLEHAHNVYVLEIGGTEYAFVTSFSDDSLSIFDVSTPGSPSLAGVIRGQGSPNYMDYPERFVVTTFGGTEYALVPAAYDNAINAIDVSDPSSPSRATGLTGGGSPNYLASASDADVAVINGIQHVFVTSILDDALTIFSVTGFDPEKTFTSDISLGAYEKVSDFTVDGILSEEKTSTFTVDGIVKKETTSTFTADGIVKEEKTDTFTADGIVKEEKTDAFTVDGIVKEQKTDTFTVDGVVEQEGVEVFTVDGIVKKETTVTFSADGVIKKQTTSTFSVDGIVAEVISLVCEKLVIVDRSTDTFTVDGLVYVVPVVYLYTGAVATGQGISKLWFNLEDSNSEGYVYKPPSGNYYSYWKTIALYTATAPPSYINNTKLYTDGSSSWTGSTVYIGDQQSDTYDQATGSGDSGDEMVANHSEITSKTDLFSYVFDSFLDIELSSTWVNTTGRITKYLVLQLAISDSAIIGPMTEENVIFRYDEV